MKKLILLFILISSVGIAQVVFPKDENGNVTYAGTITVDSALTKKELYSRAQEFFAKAFVSSLNVIQYQDKEEGEIIGKGNMSIKVDGRESILKFTLSIYVKDGKYKYIITDITSDELGKIDSEKPALITKNQYKNIQWNADYEMTNLVKLIKEYMSKPKEKDEW